MEYNEQKLAIELLEYILVQAVQVDDDATNYSAYFAVLTTPKFMKPLVNDLCRDGHADVLGWIVRASGPLSGYTVHAMNFASMNGHFNVLEWWKASGNPPMYSQLAFTGPTKNGDVAALQWWRDSGLHVGGFTDKIMDVASEFGQVAVLEWMLRDDTAHIAAYFAVTSPPGPVLRALDRSRLAQQPSSVFNAAVECGNVAVLDLWRALNVPLPVDPTRIANAASEHGHVNVLAWLASWNCTELEYNVHAVAFASINGSTNVLEWWRMSGYPLRFTQRAIRGAARNGHIGTLQWWRDSGLLADKMTLNLMDAASKVD
ncbi:hypothetical protein H9P43_006588, partial [Blastocladiella emersonii ATCC 22665]